MEGQLALALQYRSDRGSDCGFGWPVVGLGPVVVSGSFHVPSGVFAFDESRVGSPSDRVESSADQREGVPPSVISGLRGKIVRRDGAARFGARQQN